MNALRIPALLVLLCVGAYWTSLGGTFVYDDRDLIERNTLLSDWVLGARDARGRDVPYVRRLLTADFAQLASRGDALSDLPPINYYRPAVALTYLADTHFWTGVVRGEDGDPAGARVVFNPTGFHLTNLLFHALNTLLVFQLGRALVGRRSAALVAAVLFAVHPIHTESVSWIAGRTDVIAATFFLGAFWSYVRYRRTRRAAAWWTALGLFAVGMFAKEVVAALAGVLVLLEWLDHRFGFRRRTGSRPAAAARAAAVLPFFLAVLPYFVAKSLLTGQAPGPGNWAEVGAVTAVLSFFKAAAWYLAKVIWPLPLDIYPILRFASPAQGLVFLALHVAVIAAALRLTFRRREPAIALAVLGFYIALSPVSSLVPGTRLLRFAEDIDFPVAERFLYVPSLFVVLGLGWWLARLWRRGTGALRAAALVVTLALAAAATWATARRGLDWRSDLQLFTAAAATAPASVRMHSNLGLELLENYQPEEARVALFRSLKLQEEFYARDRVRRAIDPYVHNNLGRCFMLEGDFRTAIRHYETSARLHPDSPAHWNNCAFATSIAAAAEGDLELARRSLAAYRHVQALAPRFPLAREMIEFLAELVAAWERFAGGGRDDDAVRCAVARTYGVTARNGLVVERPEHALRVLLRGLAVTRPADPGAFPATAAVAAELDALARQALEVGRAQYRRLLAQDAERPALHYLLGEVERLGWSLHGEIGARAAAERSLRRALTLAAEFTPAALSLAALQRAEGDPREALRTVETAAQARARSHWPLWHESAYRAALAGTEQAAATAEAKGMLGRVLDAIAARLEAEAGADAQAWNNLGWVRYRQAVHFAEAARYEAAAASFRRALELDPGLVNAAGSLVDTLRQLGRADEAEALRTEMRARFPRHPFFR
ncbi:MAG: glycosyltransferase family 39 protein [Planctomycetes bacterium]|nr:glycosyltransferase family 39 protein [Planctomycetota bacterium]